MESAGGKSGRKNQDSNNFAHVPLTQIILVSRKYVEYWLHIVSMIHTHTHTHREVYVYPTV